MIEIPMLEEQLANMSLPVARRVLHANVSRLLELRHEQCRARIPPPGPSGPVASPPPARCHRPQT